MPLSCLLPFPTMPLLLLLLLLLLVVVQLKDVASQLWSPENSQAPGHLTLEDFHWTSTQHGRSRCRVRTQLANSTLLDLPRGRHVLRVEANEKVRTLSLACLPACSFACRCALPVCACVYKRMQLEI